MGSDHNITLSNSDRTRENAFKLKEERFRLGIRRKFFTQIVVRHWHRLPCGEVVDALSMEAFMLDRALGNQI